jgi:uroporphyrinogen decarboxylase
MGQGDNTRSLLEVLNKRIPERVPFWFMRQAGRYLPEYRNLREEAGGFLDMVYNPERASEVTMQPIRRYGMNGAILFSDILVVPHALGQRLTFAAGEGPKLDPVRSEADLAKLHPDEIHETLAPIYETLKQVRTKLREEKFHDTTLIGFAGSPWTVACYMVEGGGSKNFAHVKNWALNDPQTFQKLIDMLCDATIAYLENQVKAGAQALQLFDSWAGILDEDNFDRFVIDPTRRIVDAMKNSCPGVPVIGFPREAGLNLSRYAERTGVDALALDYTVSPSWAAANLPPDLPLQGNLDPAYLLGGGEKMIQAAQKILDSFAGRPFIFNLGHGVIKETRPEDMETLCDFLRNYTR